MLISQNVILFAYLLDIYIVTPIAKISATIGEISRYLVMYWPLLAKGLFIIRIRSSMRQKLRLADRPKPKTSIDCKLIKSRNSAL